MPIPEKLVAEAMFASDRTCCVCRLEKHKVQIHHIDEDPSNNDFGNLAVICLHCHSDAHTTGAFVRRLTPELIRLYNSSWRDIVRNRLMPDDEPTGKRELIAEALLEASLDCHYWKNYFTLIAGPDLPQGKAGIYADVWELMEELWIPKYSAEAYQRYKELFDVGLREVQRRFDRLVQLYPDVLPHSFRTEVVRATRQLEVERITYSNLPFFVSDERPDALFYARFSGVIRVLRTIARDADRQRETLTAA